MQPFDELIAVDWSAASVPKLGRDSIWIATAKRAPLNLATRAEATAFLRALLAKTRRALVAWDFPFGYPRGFARALGGPDQRAWRFAWDLIARELRDADDNSNERFALATSLNLRLAKTGPFWGKPMALRLSRLHSNKRFEYPLQTHRGIRLAEDRHCELALRARGLRPHPVWALLGAGRVGGQALTGIPRVRALRDDALLAARSRVWPFETRFARDLPDGPLIVHAEAWPSAIPLDVRAHPIKDAAQVATLARHLARVDLRAALGPKLPRQIERDAIDEEGWVLG